MLVYNGTDYTLPVIVGITVIVLFAVQYGLCAKAKRRWLKMLPLSYVLLMLILAALCLVPGNSSGVIDLSGLVALLLCGYAAICLAAIIAAWLVYWLKGKKCGKRTDGMYVRYNGQVLRLTRFWRNSEPCLWITDSSQIHMPKMEFVGGYPNEYCIFIKNLTKEELAQITLPDGASVNIKKEIARLQ
jgi:hypothetical protein